MSGIKKGDLLKSDVAPKSDPFIYLESNGGKLIQKIIKLKAHIKLSSKYLLFLSGSLLNRYRFLKEHLTLIRKMINNKKTKRQPDQVNKYK